MSDFTIKQIVNVYNWRFKEHVMLAEDSPQNLQENSFHHLACIEKLQAIKAECQITRDGYAPDHPPHDMTVLLDAIEDLL